MSTREINLPKVSTIDPNDCFRIVQQAQSRNLFYSALIADLQARVVTAPEQIQFITTAVDFTVTAENQLILVDATALEVDIVLPLVSAVVSPVPTPTSSIVFTIKKIGVSQINDVVITPTGGALIDGSAELRLQGSAFPFVSIMSDGLAWYTI